MIAANGSTVFRQDMRRTSKMTLAARRDYFETSGDARGAQSFDAVQTGEA